MALTKVPCMATMASRTTGIWPPPPKSFWVDRRPGGAREAQNLGGARETQNLGGAREALTLVGARVVLSLGGALEALNWTVPAGTKVSWTGPAEAKVSWTGPAEAKVSWTGPAEAKVSWMGPAELSWPRTGFRLGIGDFPDIGLPSLAKLGWRSLGAPLVDGMRSRAGTES